MPEGLVVVGAGGFGRETLDVAEAMNVSASGPNWQIIGVVDDAPSPENLARLSARGIPYLGTLDDILSSPVAASYVIGIGSPAVRRTLAGRLERSGRPVATLVHPAASLGSQVTVGRGTVICAGARLTTNIRLGRHVHVNPNVTIGHDTTIEDFVSLNPSASISGDCVIAEGVLVGVQGVVLNGLTVAADVVVGAAACVTRSVHERSVLAGVPARKLR